MSLPDAYPCHMRLEGRSGPLYDLIPASKSRVMNQQPFMRMRLYFRPFRITVSALLGVYFLT